jgi:hypothetical protein
MAPIGKLHCARSLAEFSAALAKRMPAGPRGWQETQFVNLAGFLKLIPTKGDIGVNQPPSHHSHPWELKLKEGRSANPGPLHDRTSPNPAMSASRVTRNW